MPAKAAKPEPEMTFEAAVERLESLVSAMEADQLPLAELIVRYEEGMRLLKHCQAQLESAEKRIEIITRNARGEAQLAPFEPATASPPERPVTPPADEISLF